MNTFFREMITLVLTAQLIAMPVLAQENRPNAAPEITHEPVVRAVRGQALTLKAKVTDDKNEVASVTLFYTLAKDAAPFKIPLKPAGLDFYVGTIEGGVLTDVTSLSYYIEAQDGWGATRETPWYPVVLRDPRVQAAPVATAPAHTTNAAPVKASEVKDDDSLPLGIIAGGAVAVIGGALLIANSSDDGGGGGDDGGGSGSFTNFGTYAGSIVSCSTASGSSTICAPSRGIEIVIDSTGTVFSDDLIQGQGLSAPLNGNDFLLVSPINNQSTGESGEVRFEGSVFGSQISGRVTGSSQGPSGTTVYSGSFGATKR